MIATEVGHVLTEIGFQIVHIAHDLHSAASKIKLGRPDFALLDVNLGGGERSLDLGKSLAASGTTVIFLSGYAKCEFGPEISAFGFLEKPVSTENLRAAFQ